MVTYIRKLTPEGLQPVAYTAASLADATQYEPSDGIYTTTNTYHTTQVLKIDAHLDRMEDSARRAGILLKLDRKRLRAALREMILDAKLGDVRFRVTVPKTMPETFIITLEPFTPLPAEVIEKGVKVATVANSARHNPAAKTTEWMHQRQQLHPEPGIYDLILLDAAGNMLEGTCSNFYAILDGALHTAGEGALPGIAQQIVLEVAVGTLPIMRVPPNIADLPRFAEAFITSSSRGIVPVIQINEQQLSDGKPGNQTRNLRSLYTTWAAEHLQEL